MNKKMLIVLELSSYQIHDLQHSPHIACIINLYNDHADWHEGEMNYHQAKLNLIKARSDTQKISFVFNSDFPKLVKASEQAHILALPIDQDVFVPTDIPRHIIGEHNRLNAVAAFTIASQYGVTRNEALEALEKFKPLPHRLEFVENVREIDFYDDAISTTPNSTIAGIEALIKLKPISTIFLGGTDRGYNFTELISVLQKYNIENIVLFPDSGIRIKELLENTESYTPRILTTAHMDQAIEFAMTYSKPDSICLLSTASPSYSLWKNFQEKGAAFKASILAYLHAK
jgi:UDP-N-acetylmuramoylalanine--D-glutamate ligase